MTSGATNDARTAR